MISVSVEDSAEESDGVKQRTDHEIVERAQELNQIFDDIKVQKQKSEKVDEIEEIDQIEKPVNDV